MKTTRLSRFQKGAALVPLGVLSAACTVSLLGVGAVGPTLASASDQSRLPDGTSVPSQAIEDPASFSAPGSIEIGRASCRERVCQYVLLWVGAVSFKKKKSHVYN